MKLKFNSPIILSFAIISFCVLVANMLTGNSLNRILFSTYSSSLTNPLTYVRMFTHVLGHASFEHFFNNIMLFLLIGPILEEKYGSEKILFVILLTALVTALFNNIFTNNALLGASGVVFSFIVLSSMTSFKEKELPLTFLIVLILYIGQEVVNGMFSFDNISQISHIIGGMCGATCGIFMSKKK